MKIVEAIETGNKITISILMQEKNPYEQNKFNLLKSPRFKAAAKQLLTRADRSSDDYTLVCIDRKPENFFSTIYIFIWVKKNEQ